MSETKLKQLNGLGGFIEEEMKRWHVPGLSIAIVKDGEVVMTEGFGYSDLDAKKKVTSKTIFPIASATKSFTAMALAMLADEGKLDWEALVRQYIPFFKLQDSLASEKVTVRDILCHRTGLPRHEFSLINSPISRREMVEQARYLQPSADFRAIYQYQNRMYATAGYLVEAITGKTWEDFVQQRIFDEIGMSDTTFSLDKMQQSKDYSKPYAYKNKEDRIIEKQYLNICEAGPAGSINSTAEDMAKYIMLQVGKGKHNSKQIVSEANMLEMHKPNIPAVELPWSFDELLYPFYGFGWTIEYYRGHKMIHHGGNTVGFTAMMTQLPELDLGVVVLVNMESCFMPTALTHCIFDRMLGLDKIDWTARYQAEMDKLYAMADKMEEDKEKNRVHGTKLSHPAEDYTGEYSHPAYGLIKVDYADGEWKVKHNLNEITFKHYHYDTFEFILEILDVNLLATFKTDGSGKICGISVPYESSADDILFKKVVKE